MVGQVHSVRCTRVAQTSWLWINACLFFTCGSSPRHADLFKMTYGLTGNMVPHRAEDTRGPEAEALTVLPMSKLNPEEHHCVQAQWHM